MQPISAGGNPAIQIDFRIPGAGSSAPSTSPATSPTTASPAATGRIASYGGSVAYFKAASYLMHDDGFSGIRNFVLGSCRAMVEDDSGIPYRYLSGWDTKLFGGYNVPIELFANHAQADLRAAYAAAGPVPQIPFGTGYQFRAANANLQLYVRH